MIVTVTNELAVPINTPQVRDFTAFDGGTATGGMVDYPLPYPFNMVGALAASASIARAMHPGDFRGCDPQRSPLPNDWNNAIQSGMVSLVIATETSARDVEELFVIAAV